jgi:hypothetical protein
VHYDLIRRHACRVKECPYLNWRVNVGPGERRWSTVVQCTCMQVTVDFVLLFDQKSSSQTEMQESGHVLKMAMSVQGVGT